MIKEILYEGDDYFRAKRVGHGGFDSFFYEDGDDDGVYRIHNMWTLGQLTTIVTLDSHRPDEDDMDDDIIASGIWYDDHTPSMFDRWVQKSEVWMKG